MRNYDPEKLCSDLEACEVYNSTSANEAWRIMKNFMQTSIDPMIPNTTKKVQGKPSPWLTDTIKRKMDKRDQLYQKSRKSRSRNDKRDFIKMRNNVNNVVRKAKANYHHNLMKENENNPDNFWSTIKKLYPSKTKKHISASFKTQNGSTSEPEQISNGFNQFFSSIIKTLKCLSMPLRNFAWRFTLQLKVAPLNVSSYN